MALVLRLNGSLGMCIAGLIALAFMSGCPGALDSPPAVTGDKAEVRVKGHTFNLEIAATPPVRTKGLGGRTEIAEDGGMIFVFPLSQVMVQEFLMRDCPIDIDIIYTDGVGRVLAVHEMKAEPARGAGGVYEGEPGDWDTLAIRQTDPRRADASAAYDQRLKRYSSKFRSTFAIELKAGSIKKTGIKENDVVEFDHAALKKMAR